MFKIAIDPTLLLTHQIVLILGLVLVSLALCIALFLKSNEALYKNHKLITAVGSLLIIVGFIIAVYFMQISGHAHFAGTHEMFGLIIGIIAIAQLLIAILSIKNADNDQIGKISILLGILLVVLVLINMILGYAIIL